jgi:PAS domain S-box-containing protein
VDVPIVKQSESWDFSESITSPRFVPGAAPPISAPLRPKGAIRTHPDEALRILLIEDSAIHAEMLDLELKHHGFACRSHRVDTREGLRDALQHFVPDLVLSDLTMPSFNGEEGLRITREVCPDVPFIFFSGTLGEQRATELLREGATAYVQKPDLARLAVVVGRALRDTGAQRERRRGEDQIRKLSGAVEHSPAGIIITDTAGTIEYVNPKFTEMTGYRAVEVIGEHTRILESGETPPSVYEEMWRTLRDGGKWRGEFHTRRKNGERFWESVSISPIRDDAETITHFVVVKEDITERKNLEAQLRRAQRIESIGTRASGLVNDLNNILASILMSAPLLQKALAGTPAESAVSVVAKCAERGMGIIRQVLSSARGIEGGPMFFQVGHFLCEIVKMMTETSPRSITVGSHIPADLWFTNADATQLHQVLLNLCANARDAMPGGGTLRIEARNRQIGENHAAMSPDAKPGPYLVITVSDTGHGIPPEIMPKIFDPFFSTKKTGKSTGLGLPAVLGIVRSHGGFLMVKSLPGKGSTFEVFLPAEPDTVPETAPAAGAPYGNGELILLVDDEESILAITQDVLRTHGYQVLSAADGIEALTLFAQHQNDIAIVITDTAMPFMDGIALSSALRRIKPALRIIASTGHSDNAQLTGSEVSGFLSKPYDPATLLRAIHTALVVPAPPVHAAV